MEKGEREGRPVERRLKRGKSGDGGGAVSEGSRVVTGWVRAGAGKHCLLLMEAVGSY